MFLASTLTEDMTALLRGEVATEFQDIELMLGGKMIKAHKVTLGLCKQLVAICVRLAVTCT